MRQFALWISSLIGDGVEFAKICSYSSLFITISTDICTLQRIFEKTAPIIFEKHWELLMKMEFFLNSRLINRIIKLRNAITGNIKKNYEKKIKFSIASIAVGSFDCVLVTDRFNLFNAYISLLCLCFDPFLYTHYQMKMKRTSKFVSPAGMHARSIFLAFSHSTPLFGSSSPFLLLPNKQLISSVMGRFFLLAIVCRTEMCHMAQCTYANRLNIYSKSIRPNWMLLFSISFRLSFHICTAENTDSCERKVFWTAKKGWKNFHNFVWFSEITMSTFLDLSEWFSFDEHSEFRSNCWILGDSLNQNSLSNFNEFQRNMSLSHEQRNDDRPERW